MAAKNLEKHQIKLSIDSSGVEHVFDVNNKTIYRTTHEAPCMRILFLRENENEGFSNEMFHIRYLKNGEDCTMTEILLNPKSMRVTPLLRMKISVWMKKRSIKL